MKRPWVWLSDMLKKSPKGLLKKINKFIILK